MGVAVSAGSRVGKRTSGSHLVLTSAVVAGPGPGQRKTSISSSRGRRWRAARRSPAASLSVISPGVHWGGLGGAKARGVEQGRAARATHLPQPFCIFEGQDVDGCVAQGALARSSQAQAKAIWGL